MLCEKNQIKIFFFFVQYAACGPADVSEGSAAYRVISSLPREDGPGLGLGEGEVF